MQTAKWPCNSQTTPIFGLPQITVWMVAVVGRGEGLEEGRGVGGELRRRVGKGLVGCFFIKNTQQNWKKK